ncbi:carboxypeptidase regulatory-like domain-containing protein, partial [Candidatus Uhrbacteria bacterium]|nr:carboxypeptidase regulatory-like domain-containing protein [Candidatus Uhrbacteria bacterium]
SQRGKQKVILKVVYSDDQVQIIEMETVVTGALQAKLLPRVQKVARQVQEVAVAVNETVKETVETTQPILQGTAVTVAPIVTIANPAVSANVINWFHYLNHFISSILSFFGLRRRRKPWGTVYDAISKTPIDLAIVRLFEKATQKLIDTQVTDKGGRFSFIAPPGTYTIDVRKPPLLFPSKIVTGTLDGDFVHIYYQEPFTISKPDEAITLSIPLDPPNPKDLQGQKMNVVGTIKHLLTTYSKATLFVSLTISALLAFYTPNPVNTILLILNCVYVVFQVLVMAKGEKPWGTVFDIFTSQPVPLAAISIFDAAQKKLLRTRLTDYLGRFNFLTPAGEYLMIASKEHYAFPPSTQIKSRKFKNVYYGGNVKVKKDKALVKINIPMQSVTEAPTPQLPQSSVSSSPTVSSKIPRSPIEGESP